MAVKWDTIPSRMVAAFDVSFADHVITVIDEHPAEDDGGAWCLSRSWLRRRNESCVRRPSLGLQTVAACLFTRERALNSRLD